MEKSTLQTSGLQAPLAAFFSPVLINSRVISICMKHHLIKKCGFFPSKRLILLAASGCFDPNVSCVQESPTGERQAVAAARAETEEETAQIA